MMVVRVYPSARCLVSISRRSLQEAPCAITYAGPTVVAQSIGCERSHARETSSATRGHRDGRQSAYLRGPRARKLHLTGNPPHARFAGNNANAEITSLLKLFEGIPRHAAAPGRSAATGAPRSNFEASIDDELASLRRQAAPPGRKAATGAPLSKFGAKLDDELASLRRQAAPPGISAATGAPLPKFGANFDDELALLRRQSAPPGTIVATGAPFSKFGATFDDALASLRRQAAPPGRSAGTGAPLSKFGASIDDELASLGMTFADHARIDDQNPILERGVNVGAGNSLGKCRASPAAEIVSSTKTLEDLQSDSLGLGTEFGQGPMFGATASNQATADLHARTREPQQDFHPTNKWQLVPDDAVCPPGLHFRVDMTTGLKYARLVQSDQQP